MVFRWRSEKVMPEVPYTIRGDRLVLKVKAFPKAGKSRITGVRGGELVVRVQAPAERGAANKELVSILAKTLEISKSEIAILSGETSRHKLIHLPESARAALDRAL
jgi:uncharacterized protein (TIGR00251 family)